MKYCEWKYEDDYNYYETFCDKTFYFTVSDKTFYFTEGNCKDNEFLFCPYCGKKIKETKEK